MKNQQPLVSIIVPAYNTEKYIGFCLSSLVNQSYRNLEIIVIDDGSSDGTREVISDYAEQDERMNMIDGEHQGANIARGLGVKKAKGDYFMFVDSDDWLERNAVERLVDIMLRNDCDIIRFNAAIEPGGKLKNSYIEKESSKRMVNGVKARHILTTTLILNNLWSQFYRADLFSEMKSFEKRLSNCEDYLNNLEIYDNVKRVLFIGDVMYHYRSNYSSTTKSSDLDRRMTNLGEQIYVYSVMLDKLSDWGFSRREQTKVAAMALDRIRSGVFTFSKSDNMTRKKFAQTMNDILASQNFQHIKQKVGSTKNLESFLSGQPLFYKVKHGKSLRFLYNEKAVAFWQATLFFRIVSRITHGMENKKNRIEYNNVAKYMRGRLGNQFFQYAAMRQIQEINRDGGEMYLNFSRYIYSLRFNNDLKDFRVRPYAEVDKIRISVRQRMTIFVDKAIKRIYRFFRPSNYRRFRYGFEDKRAKKLQRRGIYWKEDGALEMGSTKHKNKIVIGHFESARNFDAIRSQLLEEFQPIKPPLAKNKKLYDVIKENESVCISIRRGDFVENPQFAEKFNVCGEEYFKTAVKEIKKYIKNPVFIVFSDDIEWCRKNFLLSNELVYYEDGTDPVWEKLRLMYSCKHFIISNSTFSWWAQYLSQNESKVVVAPKIWTKFGYNKDIYDSRWVVVDNAGEES